MESREEVQIPDVLYKYRGLSGQSGEFVRQTIVESKVWFSSRTDFNDPFDCRVQIPFPKTKKGWKNEWIKLLKKQRPELNRQERLAEVTQNLKMKKPHRDPKLARVITEDVQRNVNDELGIFCLSTRNDDILMWSYYAEGHTGLCLGFLHRVGTFGPAYPVNYASEFPKIHRQDGPMRQMEANLLTKAEAWKHEAEWRVVDQTNGRGVRNFSPELLSEVIFGVKMSEEDRGEVRSWIEAGRSRPKLYEAYLKDGVYGLGIRPVT